MGSPKYLPCCKKTSQDRIIVFQGSHATLKIVFFHEQGTIREEISSLVLLRQKI